MDQNICSEIFFDPRPGNELRLNGSALLPIEEKSYGMFGATVVASKQGDAVLACAPHYKYFFSKFEVVEPVGTCYYAQDYFNRIEEFAPCRQEPARHGHHRFGYGMCGFSAAVPDKGDDRLFISAPGVWYWQGAVFSQSVHNTTDRPNTADGPAPTDHHQMGYATAAGDFDGDGQDDIVVGVPRGNELIGMVSIYTSGLKPIVNLTVESGGQRGQYFGASVAVADLNKDGKADLIVGSPFYTDYKSVLDAKTQERKPQYDIGKVYVYIQTGSGSFKEPVQLGGCFWNCNFGGFNAGYQSTHPNLTPHYFSWSRPMGPVRTRSRGGGRPQRRRLRGLHRRGTLRRRGGAGSHLRLPRGGGRRQEGAHSAHPGKGYQPGAADLRLLSPGRQGPGQERLPRRGGWCICQLAGGGSQDEAGDDGGGQCAHDEENHQPGREALCHRVRSHALVGDALTAPRSNPKSQSRARCSEKLRFCLKYNGKLQPDFNTADMRVKIHLDSRKGVPGSPPRAFISRKDLDKKRGARVDPTSTSKEQPDKIEHTLQLTKGREHCESYDIYVPDTIRDKISPIVISVNYTYVEKGSVRGGGLEPAVDTTLPTSFETELVVEKDCGDDNVCIPDLQISAKPTTEKLTIGAVGPQVSGGWGKGVEVIFKLSKLKSSRPSP